MKMFMKKSSLIIAAVAACAMTLSGCSVGGSSSSASSSKPKSITVWSMNGDLSPEVLSTINKKFTKQTGVSVKVETHDWDGITTKVTTALSTSTPPDVIDIGNTQLSGYAASGGLLDLTSHKTDLEQGKTWVSGLEKSGTYDGKLYGVPALLAPFAVLYNKKIWQAAGITSAPTTYAQLESDLDAIQAHNSSSDFSAMYLCGKDWYSALQWVWASGGDIAKDSKGNWQGTLSSAKAIKGLTEWKAFQNKYSTPSSRTLATDSPDQTQLFAQGKVASMIAPSTSITTITKLKTGITTSDIGSFAIPTASGKTQPTFTSGSNWVIPAKSAYSAMALKWIAIASSPQIQNDDVYGKLNLNPITVEGNNTILKDASTPAVMSGYFASAKAAVSTPSAPGWLKVEGNAVLEGFFSSIASGSSTPKQAATHADTQLNDLLNSKD